MAADDRALLVGIAHYPGIRDLKGPPNDVEAVYNWLTDPLKGNVPAANVTRIVSNPAHPNRPILTEVTTFFTDLMTQQANSASRRLGGRVYLFLNGHGFAARVLSEAALCMADSVAAISSFPHLGGQVFADDLGNRGMFDEVFLWMDCCRQLLPAGLGINRPFWPPANPPVPPRGFFWGFATTSGALAAEAQFVVGGVRRYHGVFTGLLMEALDNCKTRQGGEVYASDVANYIFNQMGKVLGPTAPPPQFQSDPVHDLLLFTRAGQRTSVNFHIQGVVAGDLHITTGQNVDALPGPITIAAERAAAQLETGIYKASVVGTARFALFIVPGDPDVTL